MRRQDSPSVQDVVRSVYSTAEEAEHGVSVPPHCPLQETQVLRKFAHLQTDCNGQSDADKNNEREFNL